MRSPRTLIAACLLLLPSSLSAAETRISTNERPRQRVPVALYDAAGNVRVVWEDTGLGLVGRTVPAAEPALAGEERILAANTHVPQVPGEAVVLTHREPTMVDDGEGGYWLFWSREQALLNVVPFYERRQVLRQEIRRQRYDAAGDPVGREMIVARSAAFQSLPAALRLANGNTVVAWWSTDGNRQTVGDDGVFARVFGPRGEVVSGVLRVSPTVSAELATRPALAADDAGRILVTWQAPDGSSTGIYRVLLDSAGGLLAGPQQINSTSAGAQSQPAAIALGGGGFLALWQGATGERLKTRIFARRLDAEGRPLGTEYPISSAPLDYEMGPGLVRTARGFFAAWALWDSSFPRAMRGVELDAAGHVAGEERNLSQFRLGAVYKASLAERGTEGVFAVWEGYPIRHHPTTIIGRRLEFLD